MCTTFKSLAAVIEHEREQRSLEWLKASRRAQLFQTVQDALDFHEAMARGVAWYPRYVVRVIGGCTEYNFRNVT